MTVQVENVLSDLIRIQSVNPPGGEIAVARYLKELFDRYGIAGEIIEPVPGRGSFIAHLGEGERRLLYVSHLDVVPVSEGWDFPPFSGEVKGGFVYGRGALDCKGLAAAEACAIINLAGTAKLNGRLIFAATADEEVGSNHGMKYIAKHHAEKIKADFAINEGAEAPGKIGGKIIHSLSVGEKGPAWIRLMSKGISSHGSVPVLENNAVVKMTKVIDSLANYRPSVVLTPETQRFLQTVFELAGLKGTVNPENADEFIGQFKDNMLVPYLKAITRMTISPNVIHGGIKTNIVPDTCEAEVDIRILPGQNKQYVLKELKPILGNVEVESIQYHSASFSTTDSQHYRLVRDTLQGFVGDAPILPTICTGATDSRYLRGIGIPCYGIGLMVLNFDPAMKASVHGKNEKIDIPSLRLISQFLESLAKQYLGDG